MKKANVPKDVPSRVNEEVNPTIVSANVNSVLINSLVSRGKLTYLIVGTLATIVGSDFSLAMP